MDPASIVMGEIAPKAIYDECMESFDLIRRHEFDEIQNFETRFLIWVLRAKSLEPRLERWYQQCISNASSAQPDSFSFHEGSVANSALMTIATSLGQLCPIIEELHSRGIPNKYPSTAEPKSVVVATDRKKLIPKLRWTMRERIVQAIILRVEFHIMELESLYRSHAPVLDVGRQIRADERRAGVHPSHQRIEMDLAIGTRRSTLPVGPEEQIKIAFRAVPDKSATTKFVLPDHCEFARLPSTMREGLTVEEDGTFGTLSETAVPDKSAVTELVLPHDHKSARLLSPTAEGLMVEEFDGSFGILSATATPGESAITGLMQADYCGNPMTQKVMFKEVDRRFDSLFGTAVLDKSAITGFVLPNHYEFARLPSPTTTHQGSIVKTIDGGFGILPEKTKTPLGSGLDLDDFDADPLSLADTYLPSVGYLTTGTSLNEASSDPDKWFRNLHLYTHALFKGSNLLANPGRRRVRVAVLDSGFTFARKGDDQKEANQWLKKKRHRCVAYEDFTGQYPEDWSDGDEGYHGTNCASLLLQISPEVDVYIANVVSHDEQGAGKKKGREIIPEHVAKAIEWAITNEVDIIPMSVGWPYFEREVEQQIIQAQMKNILMFAAASNEGRYKDRVAYPASAESVFSIYSCTHEGTKGPHNLKAPNEKAGFMFYGEGITILNMYFKPVQGFGPFVGTSFATPVAAGTAALVLQLLRAVKKDYEEDERKLRSYSGMSTVFKAMSGEGPISENLHHVMPWKLLGELTRVNDKLTHREFTLDQVLLRLQPVFGPCIELLPR